MPEGIVPELLIAFVLLLFVGAIAFVGLRTRRSDLPEDRPQHEEVRGSAQEAAVVTKAPPQEAAVEAPLKPSLRDRLSRSRRFLADRLTTAFGGESDEETWEDVEAALIQADVGVDVANRVTDRLRGLVRERGIQEPDQIRDLLADELLALFDENIERSLRFASSGPSVWLVVGVNGTGKTTTIGKLATDLAERKRSVALAAADTFRAAAEEQLTVWAQRSGAEIVKHQQGADPGAVAFDAFRFSQARDIDVLIVDTAGRLHTKTPLMDELAKIRRVIEKEGKVQEVLLVIDATAGQNGLIQAKQFADASGVTGVVLTKLDGTAKGGIAIAIEESLRIPIKLVGVGEGVNDLEPFDPKTFVDAILR